jgi:hypothetical protein
MIKGTYGALDWDQGRNGVYISGIAAQWRFGILECIDELDGNKIGFMFQSSFLQIAEL